MLLEDRKAAADPRYMKTSERKKAKLLKDIQELDIYQDKRNYDLPKDFGSIFIKFLRPESCTAALKNLNGILYGNNICETSYWLE
jgi:RNA recognition motif-containing protein